MIRPSIRGSRFFLKLKIKWSLKHFKVRNWLQIPIQHLYLLLKNQNKNRMTLTILAWIWALFLRRYNYQCLRANRRSRGVRKRGKAWLKRRRKRRNWITLCWRWVRIRVRNKRNIRKKLNNWNCRSSSRVPRVSKLVWVVRSRLVRKQEFLE